MHMARKSFKEHGAPARSRRTTGVAATLALVAAALSIAATPASARPSDSVRLSATPTSTGSGGTATIRATTSIAPDLNRFIYIYSVDGGNSKICQAATSCTMLEMYTSTTDVVRHTYVAEVREYWGGETTIAMSNRVTVMWWPA